jgi:hemerythrin
MIYEWNVNLQIGYPPVDVQHKGLFDVMNQFFSSISDGVNRAEVEEALCYLEEYVRVHFADEERIQLETNYPGYKQHKRFHEEFKILIRGLRTDLERVGPTLKLLGQIEMGIGSWLVDHIEVEDMKIGEHLRRVKQIRDGLALRAVNQDQESHQDKEPESEQIQEEE